MVDAEGLGRLAREVVRFGFGVPAEREGGWRGPDPSEGEGASLRCEADLRVRGRGERTDLDSQKT